MALAVDLDRTLGPPGKDPTLAGLRALRSARRLGLQIVLATGRRYSDALALVHRVPEFDALVAENGAVVDPLGAGKIVVVGEATGRAVRHALAGPTEPPVEFGRVVASVSRRLRPWVRELVRSLPVELVPNADRVMVVPRGVTKASGVARALRSLGYEGDAFAAVGDGENDVPMLRAARISGAVRNAPPAVRAAASYACRSRVGRGVAEFVNGPLSREVRGAAPRRRKLGRPGSQISRGRARRPPS